MKNDIRIEAEEARRLKNDTAFRHFLDLVRENQIQAFKSSAADDIDGRPVHLSVLSGKPTLMINVASE